MVFSIHPKCQSVLLVPGVACEPNAIERPVGPAVIARLDTIPEFVKACEPDGMQEDEFISYGLVQRTLAQFDASWSQIGAARI